MMKRAMKSREIHTSDKLPIGIASISRSPRRFSHRQESITAKLNLTFHCIFFERASKKREEYIDVTPFKNSVNLNGIISLFFESQISNPRPWNQRQFSGTNIFWEFCLSRLGARVSVSRRDLCFAREICLTIYKRRRTTAGCSCRTHGDRHHGQRNLPSFSPFRIASPNARSPAGRLVSEQVGR